MSSKETVAEFNAHSGKTQVRHWVLFLEDFTGMILFLVGAGEEADEQQVKIFISL